MNKKKVIFLIVIIFMVLIGLFYGWNILKDRQEKIIDIENIIQTELSLNDDKVTTDTNIDLKIFLGKFKQFDHIYIMQNKKTIYIALSETVSISFKEVQKTTESFSGVMNYSEDVEIEEIYIVSG